MTQPPPMPALPHPRAWTWRWLTTPHPAYQRALREVGPALLLLALIGSVLAFAWCEETGDAIFWTAEAFAAAIVLAWPVHIAGKAVIRWGRRCSPHVTHAAGVMRAKIADAASWTARHIWPRVWMVLRAPMRACGWTICLVIGVVWAAGECLVKRWDSVLGAVFAIVAIPFILFVICVESLAPVMLVVLLLCLLL